MVRFVISLTTLPKRLPYIKPVIASIIKKNPDIDKLYICLPFGDVKEKYIPKDTDIVKVIRCEDYGPITKIVGCLDYETDPDALILTLDDDVIVTQNLTKIFKYKAKKYPNAALSMSGWCYGSYPFNYQIVINNDKDVNVDWIQGVHGILYKRSFLNKEELLNFESDIKLLFKNDDHKISAYLDSKGIDRVSIDECPVDYYVNYTPSSRIDPISGGSISKSLQFWTDVKTISEYFKSKGYYRRCYNCGDSVISIVGLFILLGLFFILLLFGYGYYRDAISPLFVFIMISIIIFIMWFCYREYKPKYILKNKNSYD